MCVQMYHSITNAMTLGPGEMLEPVSYGQPVQQMLQNRRSSKRKDGGSIAEIEIVPEKHPQQISAEKPRPAVSRTLIYASATLSCHWGTRQHPFAKIKIVPALKTPSLNGTKKPKADRFLCKYCITAFTEVESRAVSTLEDGHVSDHAVSLCSAWLE